MRTPGSFSGSERQPQVQGPWHYGADHTKNRIGLAETDQPNYVALGSDTSGTVGFVTKGQLTKLANGISNDEFPILAD